MSVFECLKRQESSWFAKLMAVDQVPDAILNSVSACCHHFSVDHHGQIPLQSVAMTIRSIPLKERGPRSMIVCIPSGFWLATALIMSKVSNPFPAYYFVDIILHVMFKHFGSCLDPTLYVEQHAPRHVQLILPRLYGSLYNASNTSFYIFSTL